MIGGNFSDYRLIATIAERGSSNGQINWSQSSQPQAKAADQEKASATRQAEREDSACAMTTDDAIESAAAGASLRSCRIEVAKSLTQTLG
jgi:hypothetical protein